MASDMKRHVLSCHFCQATKAAKSFQVAPRKPITPTRPMSLVTMNILGPLLVTERGNRFALAIICHFPKYSKAYPLKKKLAKTVADQIVRHSMTFGIPDAALSDQGTEFRYKKCAILKSVWELLGVQQLRTYPYYHQADGISESFIRTLQEMLTNFVDTERSD